MPAFYNRATLSYGGRVIDSNTVQGELTAALGIHKAAVRGAYRPGDVVAFAVTLTNSGATDAENLTLSDDLGAYGFGSASLVPLEFLPDSLRYFVNGELQAAPAAEGTVPLILRGIRVPANGDAAILYAARVNEFAPLGEGASIVNTARLDSDATIATPAPQARALPAPGQSAPALPIFATAEITPDASARLSIEKSLSPTSVAPGEELTYTLTLRNEGATAVEAGDGAAVMDRFDPLLEIRSVRYNGAAWSAPENYSYDPGAGMFATASGQLSVPAAAFAQDVATGRWQVTPGVATIEITGVLR